MSDRWQMVSNNAGWLCPASIELSTVEMPRMVKFDLGYRYESCLFTSKDSEVVARYNTLTDAVEGHERLSKKYGLK
jgi:hypothetical protein